MKYLLAPTLPENYAETSVSRWVQNTVTLAIRTRSVVVVRGPAGMGKSSAIAAIANGVEIRAFEAPLGVRSQQVLFDSAARALGVSTYDVRHSAAMFDQIAAYPHNEKCLIVDEVQRLDASGLRSLLSIHDHTSNLPMVLVGNNAALKRTRANSAAYDQIEDRVTKIVDLEKVRASDIEAIARQWGVTDSTALARLVAFGEPTTIRQVSHVLRAARAVAEGGPIGLEQVEMAFNLLDITLTRSAA